MGGSDPPANKEDDTMKIFAILMLGAACIATPAMAQDPGPERWDGVYVGVNAGGTWANGDMQASTPYNGYNGFPVQDLNDGSFAGGLQIGYNKQMGSLGLGAEAAISFTGIKRESTTNDPGTLFWRNSSLNASAGPRLSIATPGVIFYGKGGLALGKFDVGHNQNGTLISAEETRYGYMLGAGAEMAIGPKLSLGLQYEMQDFGKSEIHVVSPNSDIFLQPGAKLHNVKAVMNYKF